MRAWKLLGGSALALSLLAGPGTAAPVANLADGPAAQAETARTLVQGRHFRRWHGRGGWGPGVGLGLGIIGGAIIANEIYRPRRGTYYDDGAYDGPYYYPSDYSGDPRRVCAENFRSFEWRTGLYTTYSGEKKLCPYLR